MFFVFLFKFPFVMCGKVYVSARIGAQMILCLIPMDLFSLFFFFIYMLCCCFFWHLLPFVEEVVASLKEHFLIFISANYSHWLSTFTHYWFFFFHFNLSSFSILFPRASSLKSIHTYTGTHHCHSHKQSNNFENEYRKRLQIFFQALNIYCSLSHSHDRYTQSSFGFAF